MERRKRIFQRICNSDWGKPLNQVVNFDRQVDKPGHYRKNLPPAAPLKWPRFSLDFPPSEILSGLFNRIVVR